MYQKSALILISALCLQSLALAQDSVRWGSSDKLPAARQPIEGMKAYYEPDKVERKGVVNSFALYRSSTPGMADELGRYMINCETREFVSTVNGKTTEPMRLIAGEELYPIGKLLCGWDPTNIFKKLLK